MKRRSFLKLASLALALPVAALGGSSKHLRSIYRIDGDHRTKVHMKELRDGDKFVWTDGNFMSETTQAIGDPVFRTDLNTWSVVTQLV